MQTSEQIDKIAEALSKAQGQMKNPEKNKSVTIKPREKPQYSYNYADLPECYDATRKALSDNSISHIGAVQMVNNQCYLFMRLMHSSGQWIASCYPLPSKVGPKEMASEMTYYRRYLFCALAGIAAEDDTDSSPEEGSSYQDRKPPVAILPKKELTRPPSLPSPLITAALARLESLRIQLSFSKEWLAQILVEEFGTGNPDELSLDQLKKTIGFLQSKTQTAQPKVDDSGFENFDQY